MTERIDVTRHLTTDDMRLFSSAGGDRNPLHTDEAFARMTPYGRPIAHGALVVVTALSAVPLEILEHVRSVSARFHRPVYPGQNCRISGGVHASGSGRTLRLEVFTCGSLAVAVEAELGIDEATVAMASRPPVDAEDPAAVWSAAELAGIAGHAEPYAAVYRADMAGLQALVARWSAVVPATLLTAMAWTSWLAGMQMPGRDGLVLGIDLHIGVPTPQRQGECHWRVESADPRTGEVRAVATVGGANGNGIRLRLHALVRARLPRVTRASLAEHLPLEEDLCGQQVLVAGAARGLGAAITGALAARGATVWAAYHAHTDGIDELQAEFGPDRIIPLPGDLGDPVHVGRIAGRIAAQASRLDGLVLAAAPIPPILGVHPDAAASAGQFIADSIRVAFTPLTAMLPLLTDGNGWLVAISSDSATSQHHSAAKAALETLVRHTVRADQVPTLLFRAPKMLTAMTNGPGGAFGAVPVERVAAAILAWVSSGPQGRTEPEILTRKGAV